MNVEIQHTADCPHGAAVVDRVRLIASVRLDVDVTTVLVRPDRPAPVGFAGSPTVLIDGENPFGGTRVDTPACALHPPTPGQVETALRPN